MGGRGSSSGGKSETGTSEVRATDKMFTALGTNSPKGKSSGSSKNSRSKAGKGGGINPVNIVNSIAQQVGSAANTLGT